MTLMKLMRLVRPKPRSLALLDLDGRTLLADFDGTQLHALTLPNPPIGEDGLPMIGA
jgi:hypothetical protein